MREKRFSTIRRWLYVKKERSSTTENGKLARRKYLKVALIPPTHPARNETRKMSSVVEGSFEFPSCIRT